MEFVTLVETKNGRRDLVNDLEPSFNSQHGYPQERSKDFLSSISDGAFNAEIIVLVPTSFQDTLFCKGQRCDVIFKVCSNIAVDSVRHLGNFIELSKRVSLPIWFLLHSTAARHIKRKHGKTTDRDEEIRKQLELTHGITDLSVRDH